MDGGREFGDGQFIEYVRELTILDEEMPKSKSVLYLYIIYYNNIYIKVV